jgi:hypothetical protein
MWKTVLDWKLAVATGSFLMANAHNRWDEALGLALVIWAAAKAVEALFRELRDCRCD